MGAMSPHPRDGRALLGHLGWGAHTHRIRPLVRIAQRRSGVVRWRVRHPQQLGPQWGIALPNCTAKATHLRMPGHCLVTLGGGPHTHRIRPMVRIAQRRSGVLRWCARHPQLGGRNCALPYITAQQRPHIPGVAGHCLVTLGDHTHTTLAHHYRSHEQRLDTVFDGSNCAQFGWRTVVCTPSLAARPPKVTTQCPAISLGCRRGPWDVEDDVHTTVQHPNCKIRCRQR